MGRKPRLQITGGLYHIISRGNNRKNIFEDDDDYSVFLDILLRVKEKTAIKIFAYCLMPNHFHLLMEVGSISTSPVMQRLLTTYSKHYNKKYKKIGHLFHGRYKSIICEKDSYLLELVRYIHLNPFRAGLVKKPSDWIWSGHREYLCQNNKRILDKDVVLEIFSNNIKQAIKNYIDFIRDGNQMGKRKDYYPEEKMPYLGGDKFVEDLAIKHNNLIENKIPEKKIQVKFTLTDISKDVVKEFKVSLEGICSGTRNRKTTQARKALITMAIDCGYKGTEIARFLNLTQGYVARINDSKA